MIPDSPIQFRQILKAAFVSQVGSHLLTLSLSAYVYISTDSLVLGSLVYVMSFFPAALLSSKVGELIERSLSRRFLIYNECFAVVLTALCGLAIHLSASLWLLCGLLALRSLATFTNRSSLSKWIKLVSLPSQQASRFKLFSLVFFLSTAVSGVLASALLSQSSILWIVGIDVVSYLLSIYLIANFESSTAFANALSVPDVNKASSLQLIFSSSSLKKSFFLVCISQAIFQGSYTSLVSYLPIKVFDVGLAGIGWFQVAASLGIIGGFLVVWFCPTRMNHQSRFRWKNPFFLIACNTAVLIFLVSCGLINVTIVLFLFMNLLYEVVWLEASAEFFSASPVQSVARVTFTLNTVAAVLMSLFALWFAWSIQNMHAITAVLASIFLTAVLIVGLSSWIKIFAPFGAEAVGGK